MNANDLQTILQQGWEVPVGEEAGGSEEERCQSTGGVALETPPQSIRVFIYSLEDEYGRIRYVGKTINMTRRHAHHFYVSRKCHKENWIKSLLARGHEPKMELLEEFECDRDEDWYAVEEFWISYLRFLGCDLTNIDRGGRGKNRLSDETRAKLSAARKGRKGIPMTPEHKAKLLSFHIGKPQSQAMKDKLSATLKATNAASRLWTKSERRAWNKGVDHSEETKVKMSAAHKARGTGKEPKSPEHRERIRLALTGKKIPDEVRAKMRGPRGPNIRTLRKLHAANEQILFITSNPHP